MAQQSAQSIAGYTWQQSQSFEVAKDAMSNTGSGGILGALMMTGGLMGGGGMMGGASMQPQTPSANLSSQASGQFGSAQPARDVFCSHCSKKFPNSAKFCPHCGDPYKPCPRCGTDNDDKASRCVSCGQTLGNAQSSGSSDACGRCGTGINPGAAFCPNCGLKTH